LRKTIYSLRTVHYITLLVAITLVAALYFGGNIIPPPKIGNNTPAPMAGATAPHMHSASVDSILTAAHQHISSKGKETISAIEHQIESIKDSLTMSPVLLKLAQAWQTNNHPTVAAYYTSLSAKLENSEKNLTFAAQFFLDRIGEDSSESVQMWDAEQAMDCFQRVLKINPDNDSATIGLAMGLVFTGQTMQGVQLLRGITQKDSTNIPANQILGQLAIQSGQFDKAIKRFETILSVDAKNTEAMYFLAEAYKSKGDKAKAIQMFEQCKKAVNKPEFSRDIDKYINTFK
jgi:lipopolysaccharide biosynthesis regulator YciM